MCARTSRRVARDRLKQLYVSSCLYLCVLVPQGAWHVIDLNSSHGTFLVLETKPPCNTCNTYITCIRKPSLKEGDTRVLDTPACNTTLGVTAGRHCNTTLGVTHVRIEPYAFAQLPVACAPQVN
jgi:hypothetical protein